MKHDIVFTDKVNQFGVRILPIRLPCLPIAAFLCPFPRERDVSYGGIKPDVHHLAVRIDPGVLRYILRHRHPPGQVTCHRAFCEAFLQPTLHLAAHVWLPV